MPTLQSRERQRAVAAIAALVFVSAAGSLRAQSSPTFEVASIKQNTTGDNGRWVRFLPGGRFEVARCYLSFVIQQVYGLRDFQIVDAPKWLSDWSFLVDIEAKAVGPVSDDQLKLMARNLLADRFKLKVHTEMRPLPVYALVTDKNGPKLQIAKDNSKPRGSGGIESVAPGWLRGTNVQLSQLALALSSRLDRPIVDQTNFTEPIDFNLKWSPDQTADDARPSLFTAVQEQLGLKLEQQKAPIEVLVIDHIERPSEN